MELCIKYYGFCQQLYFHKLHNKTQSDFYTLAFDTYSQMAPLHGPSWSLH